LKSLFGVEIDLRIMEEAAEEGRLRN